MSLEEKLMYPPNLDSAQQRNMIDSLQLYAISQGFSMKPPLLNNDDGTAFLPPGAQNAPITLYPSLFPRNCFNDAIQIQPLYNELYVNITRDHQWLSQVIEPLRIADPFIEKLWGIYSESIGRGEANPSQRLSLGLFRSDYMVHEESMEPPQIKQVEFNTIASSFGGLSSIATKIHRHLFRSGAYSGQQTQFLQEAAFPSNSAAAALAGGLGRAHEAYVSQQINAIPKCIIFVVQPNERNIFDQMALSNILTDEHNIRVFRVPFPDANRFLDLRGNVLYYLDTISRSEFEVSVIYYRAGYSPDEYDENTWNIRSTLEKSRAIKCPSVITQLSGMKKVQQVLATPGADHLERLLPSATPAEREALRATWMPMWPLDSSSEAGAQGRLLATQEETAKSYVLKPQREGGGNNIYRGDIPPFLETTKQWDSFILMKMIEPPAQRNTILRGEETLTGGVICELGVYGVCLWDAEGGFVYNESAGHLLRTKGDGSHEGGVAAGFGSLDSPCLV